MAPSASIHPETFISYSHDSQEHKDRVLDLSNRLREDGIDCHIDQYETSPPEGWPRWMHNQIEAAEFVLVICTEKYERRFGGKEEINKGQGGKWEGAIITQDLYEREANNTKFIPVLLSPKDSIYRPIILRGATYYCIDTEDGYEDLYRRLTDQPHIVKPGLGKLRAMPPRKRQPESSASPTETARKAEDNSTEVALDQDSFVLLLTRDGRSNLLASKRIEAGDKIKLHITPLDSREAAVLSGLRNSSRESIAIAYGTTALRGRIDSISQVRESGQEVWVLELIPEAAHQSGFIEMAISGYSADDIAELRARRILLNQTLADAGVSRFDRLNAGLLEGFVEGDLKIKHSPLPDIYTTLKGNIPLFLTMARLTTVLYLHLSGVVEFILKLDFRMKSDRELAVRFEGQRAREYSNVEPRIIKVRGTCKLVEDEGDDEWNEGI